MKHKITTLIGILIFIHISIFQVKAGSLGNNFKLNSAKNVYVDVCYSDSTSFRIPIENIISPTSKSDSYTNIKLIFKTLNCGTELKFTLRSLKSKKIKYVDLVIDFTSQFGDSSLIFYDNSTFTNSWAKVIKPDENGTISRELVLFKNKKHESNLNIAFTTFNRFYTCFNSYDNKVIVRECMEDRTLKKDRNYQMESILINESLPGDSFFDQYASLVKKNYHLKFKSSPAGWSSWSCYYGNINEDKLMHDAKVISENCEKSGANIFQLDDGWYGKSWGDWKPLNSEFGNMRVFSDKLSMMGLSLGLWYAPTIFRPNSDLFHDHFDYNVFYNGNVKKSFGGNGDDNFTAVDTTAFYALDLANPKVEKYIYHLFRTAVKDYKVNYFKLDFLICSLIRQTNNEINNKLIKYPDGDYSVAVYRKAMMNIRKAVGNSIFLNACGAPIGESIGIFDGCRISPDIIWGKDIPDALNWWSIFKDNIRNIILRSYFHNNFFVNDPDALVLRDYNNGNDFVKMNNNQAILWATAIGMSGGTVFINEDMNKLSGERLKIFEQILPIWGKTAYPLDFFEQPYPTVTHININNQSTPSQLVAVYNLTDSLVNKSISLKKLGLCKDVIALDCWSKTIIGSVQDSLNINSIKANSVKVLMLKNRPTIPTFLFLDANIYMGADRVTESYSNNQKELIVKIDKSHLSNVPSLYIYIPIGFKLRNCSQTNIIWQDAYGSVIKDYNYKGERKMVYEFN
jgi:hypothetical protein